MADIKGTPTFIQWKRSYENQKYNSTIHVFDITCDMEDGTQKSGVFN